MNQVAAMPLDAQALPPPRRRGRPANHAAHAVPEARVLNLAFHAFAQRGYEGTTLRSLAKQLGVSHNLLNVRFGSKAGLWRSAVDAEVARIGSPVFATLDLPDLDDDARFRELVARFCRWAAQNPEFVSLMHTEGRRATWRLDHLVQSYILPFKQRLDPLWQRVATAHGVPAIPTPMVLALLVQGVGSYFAAGPLNDRLQPANDHAPARAEAESQMFAAWLLRGLIGSARPATE